MSQALLQTRGASKHFMGLKAVDDVSLSVNKVEVVSIIGPNGAGKTTYFQPAHRPACPHPGRGVLARAEHQCIGAS